MKNKQAYPPGPVGLPFLGNVFQFRHNQLDFLLKLERTYGRMATVYIGKTPIVLLFRPEHIRYILTEPPHNFTSREVAGGLVFGNLLVLSLLARSFSKRVTQGLLPIWWQFANVHGNVTGPIGDKTGAGYHIIQWCLYLLLRCVQNTVCMCG